MRCASLVLCAASLAAQDSRFDVRSRLVLAPVAVTDASGRPVPGLDASDFVVLDNGRPQKIVVDSIDTGVPRIAPAIAVQSSGISETALQKAGKLGSMIQPIITGERGCAGLVTFDDRVNWLQECTGDGNALRTAFLTLRRAGFKTARMLDPAASAVDHLRREQNARRVVLLISESRDRGSESTISVSRSPHHTPAQDAMHTVQGDPPNKHNPKIPPPGERVDLKSGIEELARKFGTNTTEILCGGTGGTLFPFTKAKALEKAIVQLGDELDARYISVSRPTRPRRAITPSSSRSHAKAHFRSAPAPAIALDGSSSRRSRSIKRPAPRPGVVTCVTSVGIRIL